MSWQYGLMLVIGIAIFVPWLFAEVAHKFNQPDEWDEVAERKRRTARRAKQISREFQ